MLYLLHVLFPETAYAVLLPNPTCRLNWSISERTLNDKTGMYPFALEDTAHHREVLICMFRPLNATATPGVSLVKMIPPNLPLVS